MSSPNSISPAQLIRLIGTANCPIILDIRLEEDVQASPWFLPCAIRQAHTNLNPIIEEYANQKVILYCQKGLKLSQGAAAILRANGVQAEYLHGGEFAWREAGLPMINAKPVPIRWVTRHRPKIDRIACPWLICRFLCRTAAFLFVEPSEVQNVAERFDAEPFDIPNVPFSHQGALCSFDAIIKHYGLQDKALHKMGDVIRAADTGKPERVPEAAGLLALSIGLSRTYRDDLEQLNAGMLVYDALYRWARDGQDETHDCL